VTERIPISKLRELRNQDLFDLIEVEEFDAILEVLEAAQVFPEFVLEYGFSPPVDNRVWARLLNALARFDFEKAAA
jgi:hypothetical protein